MKPIPELTDADVVRFWDKVDKSEDCWFWMAAVNRQGYGVIKKQGVMYQATRWSYFIENGVDPGRFSVCHDCDTPGCVNPSHLWLGTRGDNNHDCDKKGRRPSGELHRNSKLTANEVKAIFKSQEYLKVLAVRYDVCTSSIHNIRSGKTWNHITRRN